MKTVGIMTLLSVTVTAAAPGREIGKENAVAASGISQPHAGCHAKANERGRVALTDNKAMGTATARGVR
jgi:hypothetical protein